MLETCTVICKTHVKLELTKNVFQRIYVLKSKWISFHLFVFQIDCYMLVTFLLINKNSSFNKLLFSGYLWNINKELRREKHGTTTACKTEQVYIKNKWDTNNMLETCTVICKTHCILEIVLFYYFLASWQISSTSYGLIDKMTERGQQKPNSKIWTVLFFIQF
jgi:hypothetical protein